MSQSSSSGPGYGTCSEVTPECPIQATIYGSYFNLGGNVFFALVFGIALIVHLFLGYRYKTWSFSAWLCVGCALETMGYIARSIMVSTPWSLALVSLQICGLLWGPTLMSAGISICCQKIIYYCGTSYSVLPAVLVPWVFIGTDIITVILQGSGGVIASVAAGDTGSSLSSGGEDTMIAGVCFQVAHMTFCGILMLIYLGRYKKHQKKSQTSTVTTDYESDKQTVPRVRKNLVIFFAGLVVAYTGVLIRSIYRVPEMAGGWANPIMRNETLFFVFDSTPISIAMWTLAVFHPGIWFRPFSARTKPEASRPRIEKQTSESSEA